MQFGMRWSSMANRQLVCLHCKGCTWLLRLNAWPSKFSSAFLTLWTWPFTSRSNKFIFVPNCVLVVNLVKFPQTVRYRVDKLSVYDHAQTRRQPENGMPSAANHRWRQQNDKSANISNSCKSHQIASAAIILRVKPTATGSHTFWYC